MVFKEKRWLFSLGNGAKIRPLEKGRAENPLKSNYADEIWCLLVLRKILKNFTIQGHGGPLGHVTGIICKKKNHFHILMSIHMKIEFNLSRGFRGEEVWQCWLLDASHWYTNSSLMCIGSCDISTWGLKGTIWHLKFWVYICVYLLEMWGFSIWRSVPTVFTFNLKNMDRHSYRYM